MIDILQRNICHPSRMQTSKWRAIRWCRFAQPPAICLSATGTGRVLFLDEKRVTALPTRARGRYWFDLFPGAETALGFVLLPLSGKKRHDATVKIHEAAYGSFDNSGTPNRQVQACRTYWALWPLQFLATAFDLRCCILMARLAWVAVPWAFSATRQP